MSFDVLIWTILQLNVLMDDGGNAVLCDFGLSRIRADVTTRSSTHDTINIVGSRNWLAPEILVGGTPKRPGDIYAFGMTTYEASALRPEFTMQTNLFNCIDFCGRCTSWGPRLY